MQWKAWLLLAALFGQIAGCTLDGAPSSFEVIRDESDRGVIYGENSIVDMPADQIHGGTTVSLFEKQTFEAFQKGNTYVVSDKFGPQPELDWNEQPSASYCSGVLVAPDLVLTAGHCVGIPYSCENLKLVFDFHKDRLDALIVRECQKILKTVVDLEGEGLDYALIRLSSRVNVTPAPFSRKTPEVGARVFALGDSLGSLKKRSSGIIRSKDANTGVYVTNLDVFEGNSGSPVFAEDSTDLVGILSGGESDFTDEGLIKHCSDDDCAGEFVIPIEKILADLKK